MLAARAKKLTNKKLREKKFHKKMIFFLPKASLGLKNHKKNISVSLQIQLYISMLSKIKENNKC